MSNYCTTSTSGAAPTLANASTPTPNGTVNQQTYFSCNAGYSSTGVSQL